MGPKYSLVVIKVVVLVIIPTHIDILLILILVLLDEILSVSLGIGDL